MDDENHRHVQDVLRVMSAQEARMVGRYKQQQEEENGDDVKAVWRRMLLDWMYCVVDHCQLQRSSVVDQTARMPHGT